MAGLGFVALLSGCGGSEEALHPRSVGVAGAVFRVPAGWKATRSFHTLQVRDGEELVSVRRFALRRRYTPSLFPRVTVELDQVATELAARERAKLTRSETVEIAGREARAYTIDRGELQERIAFVFEGKQEYQLLCRYRGGSSEACKLLFRSFRLI